jgi:hypothetical protein
MVPAGLVAWPAAGGRRDGRRCGGDAWDCLTQAANEIPLEATVWAKRIEHHLPASYADPLQHRLRSEEYVVRRIIND